MLKKAKLEDLFKGGKVSFEGNEAVLRQLAAACEEFDPMFQIMPGTKMVKTAPRQRKRSSELTRLW